MAKNRKRIGRLPSSSIGNTSYGTDADDSQGYLDSSTRKAKTVKTITKWDDVELDAIDAFAAQRDKILLEDTENNDDDDEQDLEEEVFALDYQNEEDDQHDDVDDEQLLRITRNLQTATKRDSDDDDEENSDHDEAGAAGWGKSKSAYYDADDVSDDEERAKEEEEEAMRIRRQQVSRMREEDYMDDFIDSFKSRLSGRDDVIGVCFKTNLPQIPQPPDKASVLQEKEYADMTALISNVSEWLDTHDRNSRSYQLAMGLLMNVQFYLRMLKSGSEHSLDGPFVDKVHHTIKELLHLRNNHKDTDEDTMTEKQTDRDMRENNHVGNGSSIRQVRRKDGGDINRTQTTEFMKPPVAPAVGKKEITTTTATIDFDLPVLSSEKSSKYQKLGNLGKRKRYDVLNPFELDEVETSTSSKPKNRNDDEAYYEEIKERKRKKTVKATNDEESLHDENDLTLAADADELVNGKRPATWNIMTNRGLTPKRKKELRNPRVKKRRKFETAMKRLSSFRRVAIDKSKVGSYSGEATGIKSHLVRQQEPTGMNRIFQDAQLVNGSHQRKYVKALYKQYSSAIIASTNSNNRTRAVHEFGRILWTQCLCMVLQLKKGVPAADKVIHFFASFLDQLNQYPTRQSYGNHAEVTRDDDGADLAYGEAKSQLVEYLVIQLMKGIISKDKIVRYRVCQLLAVCISHLEELDDDVFANLQNKLIVAVRDKESSVRTQAALALCKTQSGDDEQDRNIQTCLLEAMRIDTSSEVRRSVLWNIHTTARTLPYILERARDVDAQVRKMVFNKVVADIEDMSILTIEARDRLLDCGIKDRDQTVRDACLKMLGQSWIRQAGGDLLVFLSRLDVVSSLGAEEALKAFFLTNPEVTVPYDEFLWENLTVDSAFLIRVHAQFHVETHGYNDVNEFFPDLSKHVTYINKYINSMNQAKDDEERMNHEFIVEQLLMIVLYQDFSDEVGRRRMFECLRTILADADLPFASIRTVVKTLSKLATNSKDFARVMIELLYSIADPDAQQLEDVEGIFKMQKCLETVRCSLEVIETESNELAPFQPFLQYYIMPALKSRDDILRASGIRCLALYCMSDKDTAIERMPLFLYAYQHGDSLEVRSDALKAAFDLVTLHGLAAFADVRSQDDEDLVTVLRESLHSELVVVAVEGICKLTMLKTIYTTTTLEALVLLYFHPETAANPRLRQCLSYFFPVFFRAGADHRGLLSQIFLSTLRTMLDLHQSYKDDVVAPLASAQQMIAWLGDTHGEKEESSCNLQPQLAVGLLEAISTEDTPSTVRVLASVLNKLVIKPCCGMDVIKEITILVSQVQSMLIDNLAKNALKRFQKKMESMDDGNNPGSPGRVESGDDAGGDAE
ncbi:hypothetical protein SeMB42_g07399 [Synchytrium endobioticum]|uniref:Nuclear condensin complex subunit 3 C-terminal domain-containing protein n=1 Tax=Synchytrium endobioticum TaxID=286115 RepID=A0A507C8X4_9FUNG|nr:hypothetical protein SeMB42_g07399 [Synchytrium endobioticum]TPX38915.1 hypothetical protein SeLEV6574_g07520 [Synchytrium endobioticum]